MKNRQNRILYILLCCTCLFSCQRENTTKLLELAEAQIWEKPDSTLRILEQISSPEKLQGKEQADYALLLTQANYRCNIPAPSDSLINIAIDYYKVKELQLKYDKSIILRQKAEILTNWYLTIAIGILIVTALLLLYYYSLKMYKKQKGEELSRQKQKSIKLQERIDSLQTMVEESKNMHSQEREEAINKIAALQKEKEKKDIRIKQLETMFRAKDISIPSADAEALQIFLKITKQKEYIPAANRDSLHHWLNITHQNFATRLNDKYPSLTGREKDICYLTALDLPLDAVAQLLEVQPRSIERYISRICEKFNFKKGSKENFIDFIHTFIHDK